MGGYRPVPLDQLPIPQAAEPTQFKPAPIDQPPTPQPAGAGYMKTGGQIADIASNFLTGWLKGKQQAEQKKLAMAQQNMEGLHYGFQIAQQNAAQVAQDPNATPDQKAKAEQARQAAWKAYLDGAEQYTTPPKGQKSGGGGGGKGGQGGQDSGFKAKMKQTFGAEDPHLFSQGAMALLRTTGPPVLPTPSPQDQEARARFDREQKIWAAQDAITAARKTGDQGKIRQAEDAYRDIAGQVPTPKEENENALYRAAADARAGKEPNEATKQQMEQAGIIPKPIMPDVFMQADNKGYLYAMFVDPVTKQVTKSKEPIMKERVPPDQRMEAWQIKQDELKFVGQLMTPSIKAAHPDWTPQQIKTEVDKQAAQALLQGDFKVKMGGSSNLSPVQAHTEISKALDEIHSNLSADDQAKWDSVITQGTGGAAGGWMFRDQVAPSSWWKKYVPGTTYVSEDDAGAFKQDVIAKTRAILTHNLKMSKPKFTDEQIDDTVDELMGGPGMAATPGPTGAPTSPYDPAGIR
jgi:hypothetical protein